MGDLLTLAEGSGSGFQLGRKGWVFKQLLVQWKDNSVQGAGDAGQSWDVFLSGTSAGGY